jgi:Polyketide cyclase / dehydrase and lipid transport
VDAGIDRCWALVQDVARAPQWQRGLDRLEVVERDDQGRPSICDTVSDARLTKVRVRVRMRYEAPHRLAWSQVESDHLDSMEGSWELEAIGPGRTRATYSLAVDPGKIGRLARPLERLIRPIVMGHQADELASALAGEA